MKKIVMFLSVAAFTTVAFTSCDMFEKKKDFNFTPTAVPTDKPDWEVRSKAEEFSRRYGYAVLQDNWVKAEQIDEEIHTYRSGLILADQIIFDEVLNEY